MILRDSKFPGDIRVENEAFALIEAGHKVFLFCDPLPQRPNREIYEGITVIRIPPVPNNILRKLNSLLYYSLLRNYYWQITVEKYHQQHQFDAFHVHDLPFTRTFIDLGRRLSVPVVFDSHENFPIGLQYYEKNFSINFFNDLWANSIYNLDRWLRYEKESFAKADKIISTVPEMNERIIRLGIPADKITIVSNTLNLAEFDSFALDPQIVSRYAHRFVISYIGSLAQHRRLDTIVRAMPTILSHIPDALLLVVGQITPELSSLVEKMDLTHAVELVGWQKFSTMPSYIQASTIGVLPQEPNEHTSNTIPHKLFQYMYLQKPQVVSNCSAVSRIVRETGCGIICEASLDNVEAWADAIVSLKDSTLRQKMGQGGRQGVIDKYNWAVDKQQLVAMYGNI
ncbi:MAG: glycosyltransferase family 4 protein [Anaerolineae bacterium]|nr:glycosyltransferase family 4 protein [Anaerolineae bacterium]